MFFIVVDESFNHCMAFTFGFLWYSCSTGSKHIITTMTSCSMPKTRETILVLYLTTTRGEDDCVVLVVVLELDRLAVLTSAASTQ